MQLLRITMVRNVFGSKRSLVQIQSPRPSQVLEITSKTKVEFRSKRERNVPVFARKLQLKSVSFRGKSVEEKLGVL